MRDLFFSAIQDAVPLAKALTQQQVGYLTSQTIVGCQVGTSQILVLVTLRAGSHPVRNATIQSTFINHNPFLGCISVCDRSCCVSCTLPLQGPASEGALMAVQTKSREVIRRVFPDNYPYLADLFAACVLQAALTGEAVLDEQLATLARRDLSKFQRLKQRLQDDQGAGGGPPGRGGPGPAPSGPSGRRGLMGGKQGWGQQSGFGPSAGQQGAVPIGAAAISASPAQHAVDRMAVSLQACRPFTIHIDSDNVQTAAVGIIAAGCWGYLVSRHSALVLCHSPVEARILHHG